MAAGISDLLRDERHRATHRRAGKGDSQPNSDAAIATDLTAIGWPIYEYHFEPAANITSINTLNQHAQATLKRLRNGSRVFRIASRWDQEPRYGIDWTLGDDVAWHLFGHRNPQGISGHGRIIGWLFDLEQGMAPIILEPDDHH